MLCLKTKGQAALYQYPEAALCCGDLGREILEGVSCR